MSISLVLASNSPRRRELLSSICPVFTLLSADVQEDLPVGISPENAVRTLAERKALAGLKKALALGVGGSDTVVCLGSDTVVALDGKILGKPANADGAKKMLSDLSGRVHEVWTGVSFVCQGMVWTEADVSRVAFRTLDPETIERYVAGGSPMDKAGAYGIQDGVAVEGYEGSYSNIMGLPVELTAKMYEEVERYVENCR